MGREADAAAAADEALAMVARNPALARYRLLALDCAAVDNLAAGHFARALALYERRVPLLDASHGAGRGAQSHRRAGRSRAAAAVGAGQPALALSDLDTWTSAWATRTSSRRFEWPHATARMHVPARTG